MTTNNKNWYEQLFSNFANQYDKEEFTQGTKGEVDFLEQEFGSDKSALILDIGCGTGRHAIDLTKRGYMVEGFDLSENQLNKAQQKAKQAGLQINFFKADARCFNFEEKYNHAIMLCEGAFPLMETDDMNADIIRNAYNSIKPGGKLIFTTLSGLYPLFHSVKDFINAGSSCVSLNNTFDLMTFRDFSEYQFTDDDGNTRTLKCNERYYVPSEIFWLLKTTGFKKVEIFGARLGNYSRNDVLNTNDYEMLVVAEK